MTDGYTLFLAVIGAITVSVAIVWFFDTFNNPRKGKK